MGERDFGLRSGERLQELHQERLHKVKEKERESSTVDTMMGGGNLKEKGAPQRKPLNKNP